jgi:hypothetical protein
MKTVWKSLILAAAMTAAVSVSQAQIVVRARLGQPGNQGEWHAARRPHRRGMFGLKKIGVPTRPYLCSGTVVIGPLRHAQGLYGFPVIGIAVPRGYVWVAGYWR